MTTVIEKNATSATAERDTKPAAQPPKLLA